MDDPELLQASIQGSTLRLNATGEMTGEARIRVYARNPATTKWNKRNSVTDLFMVTVTE